MHTQKIIAFLILGFIFLSCKKENEIPEVEVDNADPLFKLVSKEQSGVDFVNNLTENLNANVLMYEYLYNGGGVAVGDFDQNGLEDLYFSSNMGGNALYLNQGNLKFVNVTDIAKVAGRNGPWKTGVTTVDINADGLLDIYVCYSGALPPEKRKNQFFINKGNNEKGIPVFEDQAEELGLASESFSNQAFFFDYDRDTDLDVILLNHNPKSLPVLNEVQTEKYLQSDDPLQGIRLFNNDHGNFKDVTLKSGISGSALSYGLGLAISDIDNDGWLDFYLSNDYTIPDYMYINNHDGTFTDQLKNQLGHTSHFSMGNNIADINNDGNQDIISLDMLPEDNKRQKLLLAPDNYEKFDLNLRSGFHYQYMRNMLQLNNGDGTFSEIGQLAGISNTDWSWAPLIADYNNDGLKDLYITNGYLRDYTNLDFINYMENYVQKKGRLQRQDVLTIIEKMPSTDLTNYLFLNKEGITFDNVSKTSGIGLPSNSNGAVYADLDNDGDLEIIVNNINSPAFIFENTSKDKDYLQIALKGLDKNTQAIGAHVSLYSEGEIQTLEEIPARGYLSSSSSILHFGLGALKTIDSLVVRWNSGKSQTLINPKPNQRIEIVESNTTSITHKPSEESTYFKKIGPPVAYAHPNSNFNDFKRQGLLTQQFSSKGPVIISADFNKDGLKDMVIGGTPGTFTEIYLGQKNGRFQRMPITKNPFEQDAFTSALAAFDANNDGNLDLYVGHGGYHDLLANDTKLQDVIYLGNGKGGFSLSQGALPNLITNTTTVETSDFNNDGSMDIFIGGGVIPGRYPESSKSYLLLNDGTGKFADTTNSWGPQISKLGLVSDAQWEDINNDGKTDLIVLGEWMPIYIFINTGKGLEDQTTKFFDQSYNGWWNTLTLADINKDGKKDILAGNVGTNIQIKPTAEEPIELYFGDFDNNGSVDPLLCSYINGVQYPFVTRDELLAQLAYLKSKFNSYESYSQAKLTDVLSKEQLSNAHKLSANYFKTTVFLNKNGAFKPNPLPIQFQFAPINDFVVLDVDGDNNEDIIALGNDADFKLRLGKADANYGFLFKGNGDGSFEYVPQPKSGFNTKGVVNKGIYINNILLMGVQGDRLEAYELNSKN